MGIRADFSHTATIRFDVPDGVTFQCLFGPCLQQTNSVPEPNSALLAMPGVLWILTRRHRARVDRWCQCASSVCSTDSFHGLIFAMDRQQMERPEQVAAYRASGRKAKYDTVPRLSGATSCVRGPPSAAAFRVPGPAARGCSPARCAGPARRGPVGRVRRS